MAYYLGIFGGQGPNPSAALINDTGIVAFAEEERFSRVKCAPNALPIASILFCIKKAGIEFSEIERIGFAWDCERYGKDMPAFLKSISDQYPDQDGTYNKLHEDRLLLNFNPLMIRENLKFSLAKAGIELNTSTIEFLPHHLCHATGTFISSGFEEANVVTIDGSGEEYATILWHGKDGQLEKMKTFKLPHTLGGYYSSFTEYLGFRADSEEGKFMGLAAYGAYSDELQSKLDKICPFDPDTGVYTVNLEYRFIGQRSYNQKYTDNLVELFGPPRLHGQPFTQAHKDIAYNVQWRLEKIVSLLVQGMVRKTGSNRLCMAGGVAMNCKMNGALAELEEVEDIFVLPPAADNGVALGAAYLMAQRGGMTKFNRFEHCYWGPDYSDDEIEKALIEAKVEWTKADDVCKEVADLLYRDNIIGWFQGRMEVGARALGNRSILANPLNEKARDKVNAEVKHRELWRPFCPSIRDEEYARYFDTKKEIDSDFMILAFKIAEKYHDQIPAVVHVDGTARPQRVKKHLNGRFHRLLSEFGKLSGHSVLINTSFNIQGEPIVMSPQHALRCFGGTGLDVLVLGDYIVKKNGVK